MNWGVYFDSPKMMIAHVYELWLIVSFNLKLSTPSVLNIEHFRDSRIF